MQELKARRPLPPLLAALQQGGERKRELGGAGRVKRKSRLVRVDPAPCTRLQTFPGCAQKVQLWGGCPRLSSDQEQWLSRQARSAPDSPEEEARRVPAARLAP